MLPIYTLKKGFNYIAKNNILKFHTKFELAQIETPRLYALQKAKSKPNLFGYPMYPKPYSFSYVSNINNKDNNTDTLQVNNNAL